MNTINRSAILPFAILAMWTTNGASSAAEQSAQPAFPSAAEATQNLYQAVQSNNEQAIARILGGPTELTSSSDEVQDKLDRQLFVQKYQEMHRFGRETNESVTLYIGAENWPFPIPLVEKNGAWRFDSDAGMQEALFRRIGENEFTAIATCHEFVAAEKRYRATPHTAVLADISPASLVAKAEGESTGDDPVLLNGYYFHVLAARPNAPGGFALIAYPAQYRSSGVMTFIVTGKDVVYEQDLGPDTPGLARAMTAFHKDSTWHIANE